VTEASDLLTVPEQRAVALRAVAERLRAARSVVLTTHLNADGDGAGSEAAVASWLESLGVRAAIINPTPFPAQLRFLLHRPDVAVDWGTPEAEPLLRSADLVLVLDTSEPNRVGGLAPLLDADRTLVVDHHPPGPSVVGHTAVQDPTAAAAGELVYDLIRVSGTPIPPPAVLGIYVALVSDTGSFRFGNTTPRAHRIAADLLARGVNPEAVFQKLYGTLPRRRLELLREALATLQTDAEAGLSWMVVPDAVASRLQATSEDFEGLVDHARSVEGTEVAILFRETPAGATKLSLRSNGEVDVNRIAREFGGGGHVKAAGALIEAPASQAVERVVRRVREVLGE
jgi:phosphoesterase RecJ-like protein